ncbi:MAG: NAD(+) synthase [Pseudomonadales bacterium]|nr:NAD(+) synthase [Pseudomonadales bacterium]
MTDNFRDHGFVRVAALTPPLTLADPAANGVTIAACVGQAFANGAEIALLPELCLSGYSCEDLFLATDLLEGCRQALATLARACPQGIVIAGLPWQLDDGRLLNVAAVLAGGRVRGIVPKIHQPNYGEFYERRWFASGAGVEAQVDDPQLGAFRICARQIFDCGGFRFGIEICEDLWAPEPPATAACLAGAEIVFNPSASNELVGKADYRRDLVRMASARALCAYVYAGAGPMESTKDVVFGGHLMVAENGLLLAENTRFNLQGDQLLCEIDVARLRHERRANTTFTQSPRPAEFAGVPLASQPRAIAGLSRAVVAHPFVPDDAHQFDARAAEILAIQSTGLARRMLASRSTALVIGLSGGLDSTLAYLVCLRTLQLLGLERTALHALTMPGPGTSEHTLQSVRKLVAASDVTLKEIPIHAAVADHLRALEHEAQDVVFENAQARERTQILFNYANRHGGIVVGTGDLSELALGWCTFNADHMASYNVNASVPKTMIGYLVRWHAVHDASDALAAVLERILGTPISPELLPAKDGQISQRTEDIVGPYVLHDFFLYQVLRTGAGPARILALAVQAFHGEFDRDTIRRWLRVFFQRFYTQQFKRTTLPPGPKVGTVSLSPRGDWRMPDEASVDAILKTIDAL